MKCKVSACWMDEDERKEFISEAHAYGIKTATFFDGSDYDSSWTFTGPDASVKKFVEDHFQIQPEFMPFDELVKQPETDAVVNDIEMTEQPPESSPQPASSTSNAYDEWFKNFDFVEYVQSIPDKIDAARKGHKKIPWWDIGEKLFDSISVMIWDGDRETGRTHLAKFFYELAMKMR